MNTFFTNLFNTGITPVLSLSEKRSIRFTNFSILFGLSFCLCSFFANIVLMGTATAIVPLVFGCLFGLGFYYQRQHHFETTKLFLQTVAISGIMITCWLFGLKSHPFYMFLVTFCAGLVLYPKKEHQIQLLWLHLICLFITVGLAPYIPPIFNIPLPITFAILNLLFVKILLFFIIHTYTKENQDFENRTNELVDSLQSQKTQIEQQAIDFQLFNKRLQKEIAEKNIIQEQLEQSNEKLKRFVYVASHDLKEPLRSIGGFTQLLQRELQENLDEEKQEFLNFVTGGVKRMSSLLDDLLVYARIENEESKEKQLIDLNKTIILLKHNLHNLLQRNQGTLIVPQQLPSIHGNAVQISQLFQNLISNAIKFKSKKAPIIEIKYQEVGNQYIFSVQDNGIGIEEKQQAKIFEAFQRLHKHQYEGSGIGLSICEKVVKNHQGKIWLNSTLNIGTTFYFSIPKISEPISTSKADLATLVE